jgi:antibiotic biosynthesis monooxygenase (ABM) superfamily enzyme
MYVLRSEFTVSPFRLEEAIAWNRAFFEHARTHPGHRGGALVNSRGQPTVFTRGTTWDDEAALRAFWQSPEFRAWIEANPIDDLLNATRPSEAWETVEFRQEPGTATYAITLDWLVEPGKIAAFEDSRREFVALRHDYGQGVVSTAILRSLGDPRRYSSYASSLSQEDAARFQQTPEFLAWQERHQNAYTSAPPRIDVADVLYVAAPVTV